MERTNDIVDLIFAEDVPPVWAMSGLFLQGGVYTIGGEAGAGKSTLCYTLAIAAATGQPALGGMMQAIEPKRILYFDEENGHQDRTKYIRRAFYGLAALNGTEPDLNLLEANLWCRADELGGEDWQEKLAAWIDHVRPHIIIFDTANPCFGIKDENSNSEAELVIKALKRLLVTIDPRITAIIIKHAKIRTDGAKRTLRGAKAWESAVDGVVFHVKAPGRPRKGHLNLTRLEEGKTRAYGLRGRWYITPSWSDEHQGGLLLNGSPTPNMAHKEAEDAEDEALKVEGK